jgi:hypothetical protein
MVLCTDVSWTARGPAPRPQPPISSKAGSRERRPSIEAESSAPVTRLELLGKEVQEKRRRERRGAKKEKRT